MFFVLSGVSWGMTKKISEFPQINFWLCQRIFGFVSNSAVARVCSRIFYVC